MVNGFFDHRASFLFFSFLLHSVLQISHFLPMARTCFYKSSIVTCCTAGARPHDADPILTRLLDDPQG
jgi:hypothetical protein